MIMNWEPNGKANVNGTSFHGTVIRMPFHLLMEKIGEPHFENHYEDKVRYEWVFACENGKVVTVYDWKQYANYPNKWNVGGYSQEDTEGFMDWFLSL